MSKDLETKDEVLGSISEDLEEEQENATTNEIPNRFPDAPLIAETHPEQVRQVINRRES